MKNRENHDFLKKKLFLKKKTLGEVRDPPEDRVISMFVGCLPNHDRTHSHEKSRRRHGLKCRLQQV